MHNIYKPEALFLSMKEHLLILKERAKRGFAEFKTHPLSYTTTSAKNLAKNYWDVASPFATEWGISKYGLEIIKEYNPYIRTINAVATAIPILGDKERGGRNLCLQAASWAFFTGTPIGKVTAGGLALTGVYFERKRRLKARDKEREKQEKAKSKFSLERLLKRGK